MIVGDPTIFAIESSITEAYEEPNRQALGYFLLHVAGRSFGVRDPQAMFLTFPVQRLRSMVRHRGKHRTAIDPTVPLAEMFEAVMSIWLAEDRETKSHFGMTADELSDELFSKGVVWVPDSGTNINDFTHCVLFDCGDRVRVIAFKYPFLDKPTFAEVRQSAAEAWLSADTFYGILATWLNRFEDERSATAKLPPRRTTARLNVAADIERHCAALGLQRTCPFDLKDVEGTFEFAALLPQFGGPRGMVVDVDVPHDGIDDDDRLSAKKMAAAGRGGLYWSRVGDLAEEISFVECLQDWGFYGRPEDLRPEVLEPVTRPSPSVDQRPTKGRRLKS